MSKNFVYGSLKYYHEGNFVKNNLGITMIFNGCVCKLVGSRNRHGRKTIREHLFVGENGGYRVVTIGSTIPSDYDGVRRFIARELKDE
jgi:hypothetical protein